MGGAVWEDWGMARGYVSGFDLDQAELVPATPRERLPEGHVAWFVDDVVAALDTAAFHERRRVGGRGRAGYDPDRLLALLLYAYCQGVRSSRRIEALCEVDVAFEVLARGAVPDHSTIARFRAEHAAAIEDLFVQVLALCARAGLARLGVVALDGTKLAADASRFGNRSERALRSEVAAILAEAAETDAAEDRLFGEARGDELPAALARPGGRVARLRACLADIEASHPEPAGAARRRVARAAGLRKEPSRVRT
jgi:transposase